MSVQFHVAPSTVIKAYRQLRQMRYIVKIGKTFSVGEFDAVIKPRVSRTVCFFNYHSTDFRNVFKNTWLAPAYQKMERTLLAAGYRIQYESTDNLDRLLDEWSRKSGSWPDGLFFYKLSHRRLQRIDPAFKRIVLHLHTRTMPVLIDWHKGDFSEIPSSVHILSRGNIYTTRARAVADYLIRRGYDEAVLVYDETRRDFGWLLSLARIYPELLAQAPSFRFTIAVIPGKHRPDIRAFYHRLYSSRSAQSIRNIMSKYQPLPLRQLEQRTSFINSLSPVVTSGSARRMLLFMEDSKAVEAISLCGKNSPGTGILSFENDPRYYHLGVSCCVPDWERMGYLMAHAIIGDFPVERTSKGFIRVNAEILERGTA